MELVEKDTFPQGVDAILREDVGALGGTPDRRESCSILDFAKKNLGLAVALLDGPMRRGRSAMELEVQLCETRQLVSRYFTAVSKYATHLRPRREE